MNTQELKEIYEANPNEWIVLVNFSNNWEKLTKETPTFTNALKWKLISIKHKDILEAYLADNDIDIQVYFEDEWFEQLDFIEYYNPDLEYRLKEKEDVEIPNIHTDKATDMVQDSKEEINNFQDFGFTADFEGEILKEVDNKYIGWIKSKTIGLVSGFSWFKDGGYADGSVEYSLTPIKKEWYEYPENFPALMTFGDGMIYLVNSKRKALHYLNNSWKLATKAERNSLYVGDK